MKTETKQKLEKTLDASYNSITKDGNEKALGAIRCITGLTQGDQGFVHLENIYIKQNKIQLGAYHKQQEEHIKHLETQLERINNEKQEQINDLIKLNQELVNRIEKFEQFITEINQFHLD